MEHLFPQIQVKTKKKVFIKNRRLFSPNSREDQKNKKQRRASLKTEHFFPQIQVKTKKKSSSSKIEHFFPQIYAQMYCTPIQIIGGMQMWTILKLLRGYSQIIGGDISPHPPPLVLVPLVEFLFFFFFLEITCFWPKKPFEFW